MTTISVAEACSNIEDLWNNAENGPVTVLSAGEPVAVVLLPTEYEKLTPRSVGSKPGLPSIL